MYEKCGIPKKKVGSNKIRNRRQQKSVKYPKGSLPNDLFLSYARKDSKQVERFVNEFGESGLTCTWDRDFTPGENFELQISEYIQRCRCFCVFLSVNTSKSFWVRTEVGSALHMKKPVLAIELEKLSNDTLEADILKLLGKSVRISALDSDFNAQLEKWVEKHFPNGRSVEPELQMTSKGALLRIQEYLKQKKYLIAERLIKEKLESGEYSGRDEALLHDLAAELYEITGDGYKARDHLWWMRNYAIRNGMCSKVPELDKRVVTTILHVDSKDWANSAHEYENFLEGFPRALQWRLLEYIVSQIQAFAIEEGLKSIADLCCGPGALTRLVTNHQLPMRVIGYDIGEMIDRGNELLMCSALSMRNRANHEFREISKLWKKPPSAAEEVFDAAVISMAIFQFGLRERVILLREFSKHVKVGGLLWLSTDAPDFEFPKEKVARNEDINKTNPFKRKLLRILKDIGYPQEQDVEEATTPTFRKDTLSSLAFLLEACGFSLLTTEDTLPVIESERTGAERVAFTSLPVISRKVLKKTLPERAWKESEHYFKDWQDTIYGTVLLARRTNESVPFIFIQHPAPRQTDEEVVFAAAAVLKRPDGSTLFAKRGCLGAVRDFPNTWSLPSSMAKENKSLRDALLESLKKRLGIERVELKPLAVRISRREGRKGYPHKLFVMTLFHGLLKSKPHPQNEKYIEIMWATPREVLNIEEGPHGLGDCVICYQDILRLGWRGEI